MSLLQIADFIRKPVFTIGAGSLIILVALGLLIFSFVGSFVTTPPANLEHNAHVALLSVETREARRAGLSAGDIVLSIAGVPVENQSIEELNAIFDAAQRQRYQEAPSDISGQRGASAYSIPITVYRAGEEKVVALPLPAPAETANLGDGLSFPTLFDAGLVMARLSSQGVAAPDGASISMMGIWLGGNEAIPTLNLDPIIAAARNTEREYSSWYGETRILPPYNNEAGLQVKGGFGQVRGIDRWLILYPLGAIAIIVLALLWIRARLGGVPHYYRRGMELEALQFRGRKIHPDSLLNYIVLIALVMMLLPQFWLFFSDLNWRSDLIDDLGGAQEVEALPDDLIDIFHIRSQLISADVNRTEAPANADITRETLIELRRSYKHMPAFNAGLLLLAVSFAVLALIVGEKEGYLSQADRVKAVVMLLPSILLLAIFVYGFIGQTVQFSLSDWGEENKGAPSGLTEDLTRVNIGLENYQDLMTDQTEFSFRNSLVNTFFFTAFFLGTALTIGFILAFLVDQRVRGESLFRTIFLFPMSLSLVVTGTVWNWLLQPTGGINQLPELITDARLPGFLGGGHIFPAALRMEALDYLWINSREILYPFTWDQARSFVYLGIALLAIVIFGHFARTSERATLYTAAFAVAVWAFSAFGYWEKIWLPLDMPQGEFPKGYYAALSGVVLAATWQMSGYVMALFLAGIRGVPEELREAARVDGCAEWQVYAFIILPSLRPIVLSAIIILGHISLKIFDLIFAMSSIDTEQTKVPGIVLYSKAFRGNRFASGSAVAVVMLVLVSIVIVPYLWSNIRNTEEAR